MTQTKDTNVPGSGVRKFTIGEAQDWMQHSGVSLADVLNEDEQRGLKLGAVGFMRAPAGQTTSFSFDYDARCSS